MPLIVRNSAERHLAAFSVPHLGLAGRLYMLQKQHNLNPDNLYFSSDGDIHPLLLSFCIKDLPLIKLINNCWLGVEYLDFLNLAGCHRCF